MKSFDALPSKFPSSPLSFPMNLSGTFPKKDKNPVLNATSIPTPDMNDILTLVFDVLLMLMALSLYIAVPLLAISSSVTSTPSTRVMRLSLLILIYKKKNESLSLFCTKFFLSSKNIKIILLGRFSFVRTSILVPFFGDAIAQAVN